MANTIRHAVSAMARSTAAAAAILTVASANGHAQSSSGSVRADCSNDGVAAAGATAAAELALALGAVKEELSAERRHADWRFQSLAGTRAAIADPSSHLHGYGSYYLTDGAAGLLRARCMSPRRVAAMAASYGVAVGVLKEVADGYYTGFSVADLAVDFMGVGYSVAQQAMPAMRHVLPTFSVAPAALRERDVVTNYGAQTFWLSTDVEGMLPASARAYWPAPVRVSIGRRAFQGAERDRIVLGLDLNSARLPGNHPAWRAVKSTLAKYRLPGPAIELSPRVRAVGLYW